MESWRIRNRGWRQKLDLLPRSMTWSRVVRNDRELAREVGRLAEELLEAAGVSRAEEGGSREAKRRPSQRSLEPRETGSTLLLRRWLVGGALAGTPETESGKTGGVRSRGRPALELWRSLGVAETEEVELGGSVTEHGSSRELAWSCCAERGRAEREEMGGSSLGACCEEFGRILEELGGLCRGER